MQMRGVDDGQSRQCGGTGRSARGPCISSARFAPARCDGMNFGIAKQTQCRFAFPCVVFSRPAFCIGYGVSVTLPIGR